MNPTPIYLTKSLSVDRGLIDTSGSLKQLSGVTLVNSAMSTEELHVHTIVNETAFLLIGEVIFTREIPVTGDNDLLATRELELSTTQSLLGACGVGIPAADGHEHLANGNTRAKTERLAECTTHSSLEPIGTSA